MKPRLSAWFQAKTWKLLARLWAYHAHSINNDRKIFRYDWTKIHPVSLNFEIMKLKLICEQAAFRNVHVERLKIRLNWNSSMHTLYYFSTSLAGDTLQSGKKIMIRPQNSAYNLYENPSWVQILKQIIWNLPESQSLSGCKSHAVGGR